jgi:hypothetical protein
MFVELIVGVGIGYIPCGSVLLLFFCVRSSLKDVDNFGQDMALSRVCEVLTKIVQHTLVDFSWDS